MKITDIRTEQIEFISNRFPYLVDSFDESIRLSAISILAMSINNARSKSFESSLDDFEIAIGHITQQKDTLSYKTLSTEEKLLVDTFASSEVSKQKHKVVSQRDYLFTQSRILDAYGHSSETRYEYDETKRCSGFLNGFTSLKKYFLGVVKSVFTAKPGEKNE
jgi:hypothetical protein